MYTDRTKKRWPRILLAAVALAAVLLAVSWVAKTSRQGLTEEGEEAIRLAVQRSALQCYVVEGMYPPDLAYLEEHYGLRVNTEDYYVIYDAFASNLPPDVRVTKRG